MTRSPMSIGFASVGDGVNTSRYLLAAAATAGHDTRAISSLDGAEALAGLDLMIVVDPFLRSPDVLRKAPCPVAGYLIDVHQQLPVRLAYARYFDHVFVAQPAFLAQFAALPHPSAHWLPLACDRKVHFLPCQQRIFDVGFVGKLGYPNTERYDTLKSVLARFSTNDVSRFYTPEEMGATYSRSKIVFNKSINRDVNMRFFEALASGALLVTDRIGNGLKDLATEGVHYVGYNTAEEASEKIAYYLAHEEERCDIAAAGQALAFERHTYAARLQSILDLISANVAAKSPARNARPRDEIAWRSECYRLQGASLRAATGLLMEGKWTSASLGNAATGAMRGIVRPLRQKLRTWSKRR